jgi:thiol-disulfide isomerase/thioredoxin
MSTQNAELSTTENNGGRNPIVLIGGFVILVVAALILVFGGALFGNDAGDLADTVAVEQQAVGAVSLPADGPPLQVGDQPYEFALQDVNGETVALSQFIGRPILVNFWATWCGPCRIEMPELQAVSEQYKDDGFVILALDQSESAEEVVAYFDELGLTFTALLDEDNRTSRGYGIGQSLPSSIFINPEGEISVIHRGVMTRGQLDSFLAETIPGKSVQS